VRKIIVGGLFVALIAAFAASAAPALAHEFVAKGGKGVIQDKNIGNHVFEAGTAVTCTEEQSKGVIQTEKATENKEAVVYKGCKALGAEATVSQVKYDFSAEGKVALENEVTIKVLGLCEIKVPSAANQSLGKVAYANVQGGRIELTAEVTGITANAPALCGGNTTTAKYKGTSLVEDTQGGVLEWV
jgi:hypothetical protein